MVRSVKPFIALGFVLGTLAGCSILQHEERPAWRTQAEEVCLSEKMVQVSAYVQPAPPIDGPGICGMVHPFKTTALANGTVTLDSRATLACPMIPMLDRWLMEVIQPLAQARFGEQVTEIKTMGSYGCRSIDHIRGAAMSEHSFGNAIDVAGFILASGREINVMRGWKSNDEQERAFLHEVQAGACTYFTTVLAPGADVFHYNHIHVDLARHAMLRDGTMHRVCKPVPDNNNTAMPVLPPVPDINAEGEDLASPQGAISLSPVVSAAAPQVYKNYSAPVKAPNSLLPPAPIGKTGYAPLPQRQIPQSQAIYQPQYAPEQNNAQEINTSQFDLPGM